MNAAPVRILLMEDDPGDVELILEALADAKIRLCIDRVADGEEGMRFLRRQGEHEGAKRPDLVLLDLNMPRMDGREVLAAMKSDRMLRSIPVVVLTTSEAEADILASYDLGANCYLKKPLEFPDFLQVVKSVEDFWLTLVKLPPREASPGARP
ncbi:MAG: response regulator [Solidesulfovibrio sp. DCME]|uniref:response regulator n=1 Tax=Solidesulfovibrio sp. DCME TaxID=3447380 RepID=UPI003D13BD38